MKIGLFDSGLGGLTILKAVAKQLPEYDYEFYGDTANLPYGDKSEADIFELTRRGVEHLFLRDCAIIIVACNTASAETLRRLQDEYLPDAYPERKILGVIIPTIEEVIEADLKNVLLIGTRRTIESHKYELEFAKFAVAPILVAEATPVLVPLIEMGDIEPAVSEVLTVVTAAGEVDGVVLGCTHYSVLKDRLRAELPAPVRIFSQDEIIPNKLHHYLENHPEIKSTLSRGGSRNVFLTDASPRYDDVIRELLGGAFIEA